MSRLDLIRDGVAIERTSGFEDVSTEDMAWLLARCDELSELLRDALTGDQDARWVDLARGALEALDE